MRLFFFSPPWLWLPSPSLSLASRFMPLTELVVLRGVCGGVDIGMPVMKETFPWAMVGRLPATRGGLLIIVAPGA